MSHPVAPDEGSNGDDSGDGPKRKGKVRKKHTVAKVLLVVVLALSLVTALGVVYFYRHLKGNLTVVQIDNLLENRPEKEKVEGPKEPLNILVMGSDTRDCEGSNIDGLTGGGSGRTPRSCCTCRPTGSGPTASASRATPSSTGRRARRGRRRPIPGART